jgi:pyridoxamine 5'-phosphate oxidase
MQVAARGASMPGMTWHEELLPEPLPQEPLALAALWLEQVTQAQSQANANAMVLASADAQGRPSARVVLCKEIRPQPGYLSFYGNYESRKGAELAANPRAAAVMYWPSMRRQVRIEGPIVRSTAAQSDAYFASRPWQSRIGAWASQQSAPIASRAALIGALDRAASRFGVPSPNQSAPDASDPGVVIARPAHWGGWQLWAEAVELWVEGSSRLHDRARWTRSLAASSGGYEAGRWSATRLNP